MTRLPVAIFMLHTLCAGCDKPEVDTEDAYAICDWMEANDPVDCAVDECFTVLCQGDNVESGQCEPVIEASEQIIDRIHELGHRGLPGVLCYSNHTNEDECADRFVNCYDDAHK